MNFTVCYCKTLIISILVVSERLTGLFKGKSGIFIVFSNYAEFCF